MDKSGDRVSRLCMPSRPRALAALVGAWLFCVASAPGQQGPAGKAPAEGAELRALLGTLQGAGPAEAQAICAKLVSGGPATVAALLDLPPETGAQVRLALYNLALYVARPGAQAERRAFATALAAELGKRPDRAVKTFILEQLKWAPAPEAVAAVAACLGDRELLPHAAMALCAASGDPAKAALRDALGTVDPRDRCVVIQALGSLRDAKAAGALRALAGEADRNVRSAALAALGNIGDPAAADLLAKASQAPGPYERSEATAAYLLLARRLADAGQKDEAERIYRALWQLPAGAATDAVRGAALHGLAAVMGAKAMPEVRAGMKSGNIELRATAADVAVGMAGRQATEAWVAELSSAAAADKVDLLGILARRGDAAALPGVLACLKDAEEKVRVAAIGAAQAAGGPEAAAPLLGLLAKPASPEGRAAAQALIRMPPGPVDASIASVLVGGSSETRAALLGILASRRAGSQADAVLKAAGDEDAQVRTAAVAALGDIGSAAHVPAVIDLLRRAGSDAQREAAEGALAKLCTRSGKRQVCVDAVAAAARQSPEPAGMAMHRVLGRVGGPKALAVVVAALGAASPATTDNALRVLAGWPDESALPELLKVARQEVDETRRVLALRGYLRLVRSMVRSRPAQAVTLYHQAWGAAAAAEKKAILAGLADTRRVEALNLVASRAADADAQVEAVAAAVKLAGSVARQDKAAAVEALKKVIAAVDDTALKAQAERALQSLERGRR